MKRNAIGLASVCVLSTMVLISVSSTTSLMVGIEDKLIDGDAVVEVFANTDGEMEEYESKIKSSVDTEEIKSFTFATLFFKGSLNDPKLYEKSDFDEGVTSYYNSNVLSKDQFIVTLNPCEKLTDDLVNKEDEDILFKREISFSADLGRHRRRYAIGD